MSNIIETAQLIKMLKGACQNLILNKELVDSLNVFPVPDGDTGTNMGLTITAAVREMETAEPTTIPEAVKALSKGALKGARGNSGVILSQIFKGIAEVLADAKIYNTKNFAKALNNGSHRAYDAVTQPKEGTILTVIRLMSDYAVKISARITDFTVFFQKIIAKGNEVLDDTPNLLPILKKAGVVDSGGQGLMFIIIGMYNAYAGIEMQAVEDVAFIPPTERAAAFDTAAHDLDDIKFAYCTEFFILNLKKHVTTADIDRLRDQLMDIGDCVLVIGELDLIKVHVHTNSPDKALEYALKLGELNLPKIENMLEQNRKLKEQQEKNKKELALVSICSGEGFAAIFKELGASDVLEGGQTMNPSVDDIVKLVNGVNAKTVFVLPNNKNIILACEQAKELVSCNLVTIATVNVPQGVAAAMNFDIESKDTESLQSVMENAAKAIACIEVTHAVRDTEINGFDVHNGDVIAVEKDIIAKGNQVNGVVLDALATKDAADMCVITLYYGEGVSEAQGEELQALIMEKYPDCDVILLSGGQPHYFYFISVE